MIEWFQEVLSNPAISQKLPEATFETLAMTLGAGFFAAVGGLPLGVTLYATSSTGIRPQRTVNNVVGTIVNIGRSIPFLILVISIIPFTRFVVGTSIGWQAATLPLAIGAIPFYARLVEQSLREVSSGTIDAVRVQGATRMQLCWTLVRESLPSLVSGLTVTVVTLVSYTVMAGAVGGGGLGQLAMNYGYSRFSGDVMLVTVVVIVLLVQGLQFIGDRMSRLIDHR